MCTSHYLYLLFVALKLLTDPDNIPALINCAHGKDRTGVITALVLWCVGWSKEEIVADYAQSQVVWQFVSHKVKVVPLGLDVILFLRQSAHIWHSHEIGGWLPLHSTSITALWPNNTAWWQRHVCEHNLPRVVTWWWNDLKSNSSLESCAVTITAPTTVVMQHIEHLWWLLVLRVALAVCICC